MNLGYKFLSQELTRFRMKTVDENLSIRDIEEKIGFGLVEELIFAAHNELKLIRLMKNWKPWEMLYEQPENKEEMINLINARGDNPFPTSFENFDNIRHDPPKRRPSANLHPEENMQ